MILEDKHVSIPSYNQSQISSVVRFSVSDHRVLSSIPGEKIFESWVKENISMTWNIILIKI